MRPTNISMLYYRVTYMIKSLHPKLSEKSLLNTQRPFMSLHLETSNSHCPNP